MKLKTLKDLKGYYLGFEKTKDIGGKENTLGIAKEELKQEAIKWVMEMKEDYRDDINIGITNWIKHFFNITEEDLK